MIITGLRLLILFALLCATASAEKSEVWTDVTLDRFDSAIRRADSLRDDSILQELVANQADLSDGISQIVSATPTSSKSRH